MCKPPWNEWCSRKKISVEQMDKVIIEIYSYKNTRSKGGFT